MAVCCYAKEVVVCLVFIFIPIIAQEDRSDYSDNYKIGEGEDNPALNEFLQNVLNHKDDFTWIENNAKKLNLPIVERYEKDIEPRIRDSQLIARSRRRPINDFSYLDYNGNDYEDETIRRTYRRVPGGFHGRMPRRNRLLNSNRNKRGINAEFNNYDYDSDIDGVEISPESENGLMDAPGNKYVYSGKNKYRRYLQNDLRSSFFSDSNGQEIIVIDDTAAPVHHDILGLKKYRERNRKKIAEKDNGFKLYKKRSIYNINDPMATKTNDFIMKSGLFPQMPNQKLPQSSPFGNFSFQQNSVPYANIINDAVNVNVRNYDVSKNNTAGEESIADISNTHDCAVKLPITSHFEGLMYPSIQNVLSNISSNPNIVVNKQSVLPTPAEASIVAKNIDSVLKIPTTAHVNNLYDVTYPTSAIEQRILATNDYLFPNQISTTTHTINAEESPGFDKLIEINKVNTDQRILEKSAPNTIYRVKGSNKPPNKIEDRRKNPKSADSQRETDNRKSLDYSENYEDYAYDEQSNIQSNSGISDAEILVSKQEIDNRKPPSHHLKEKPKFHARRLLNLDDDDCKDGDQEQCRGIKARGLPDFFGMSNEEDYKDDYVIGKQLLKKSSSEGEEDDGGGDPYIDKKLKFMVKKKEKEMMNAKSLHEEDVPENDSNSKPVAAQLEDENRNDKNRAARNNGANDESNIKLCGKGKNKVYCNMKDEKEDNAFPTQSQTSKNDLKKKYIDLKSNKEVPVLNKNDHHSFNPSKPYVGKEIDLKKQPLEEQVKIIQISEIVNPPPEPESKQYPSKKVFIVEDNYNNDQVYSRDAPYEVLPPSSVAKNTMSRQVQDKNGPSKLREESNQDIIEAGFKINKPGTKTDDRIKRKNKFRTYLDRLRLNNNRKSKSRQSTYHKLPKNSHGDYGQTLPQSPKYKKSALEPFENDGFYVRKERSYQQPYNFEYPSAPLNRRNSDPLLNAQLTATNKVERVTDAATEMYPANSKPPIQYIEYQKEKPAQVPSNINTEVAAAIVNQIFEAINANPDLGSTLGKGLCKQTDRQKNIQDLTNIDKNSTTTDLKDTQHLLESLMVAINKIIEEKVKSRLCKPLPPPLQSYLKTIVKIPKPHTHGGESSAENLMLPQIKSREAVEDHPEAEQTDFLFFKDDNETPEIKRRLIKYKMKIVKSLLNEYKQMSGKCKVKMRFVRDYLQKNLAVLQTLYAKCGEDEVNPARSYLQGKQKKHTSHPKGTKVNNGSAAQKSIDEQLEKISWDNKKDKLLADSDIEKIVRQTMRKDKREAHPESNDKRSGSEQYRTLVKAVEKVRKKQEKEEKLAKLFGEKRSVRNENYETIRSSNKEAQDFGQLNFEEPVVFSMDN